MGLFGNDQLQQPMSLGVSNGASMGGFGQPQTNPFGNPYGQQQQQQMGGGMAGGSFMQGMAVPQGQLAPPSETDILIALMNANAPIERWLMSPSFQAMANMISSIVTLSMHNYLKGAVWKETDAGLMIDLTSLPTDVQSVSVENVMMEMQKVQGGAQQAVQQQQMQQQQIAAMAQQSLMGTAMAGMADPGMMQKAGGAMGGFARNLITGGR